MFRIVRVSLVIGTEIKIKYFSFVNGISRILRRSGFSNYREVCVYDWF